MEWSEGMRVEACRSENEYRRAWFEGVIVSANTEGQLCKICYDKIVTKFGQPLVQDVHPSHLRPIPPHAAFPLHCSAVEAYENNCWWRGVTIRLVPSEEELWAVYILDSCIIKACRRSDLRPALQWQGGTWTVVRQERDPNIEQVTRFLMDKDPKISFANEAQVTAVPRRGRPVSRRGRGRMRTQNVCLELTDLPNEAQVTTVPGRGRPVFHRGRGGMRTQNVSFELTDFAGDNSRISCRGRKKERLVASIVPQSIQKDTGDNSKISCAGKKLKQIEKFVPPHIQEDVGNNSTISGEREKLMVRTQNVSFELTDLPNEAQVTTVPRRGRPVSHRGRGRMRTQNVSFELTDIPNEAQVTTVPRRGRPVSHLGRGGMKTQNVSFEITDFAGDNSRISCRGRKKKRLVASIVPQSIQKDTGDNSRISCAGKKLKQIAKFVPLHIQEDVGNNSIISGEKEKLRVRTQNVSFELTDLPNETQVTTVPRRGRPVSHRGRGRMRTQNVSFELTDLPNEAQVTTAPRRPNEAQVTAAPRRGRPVSHRGRGGMRTQNVSFELTDFAGDNSRNSCRGRKRKRLVASIVPQSIQKDTGDNSRISCAGKKLKLIAKFVPPHIQEDVGNNSTISGEREKLRVITDIMPLRIQEPSETHETWNGVMALDYQNEDDIAPLLSPEIDSSKRVDEERNCRESPMGNEIQNLETDGEARRLEFSESKGRELVLLSRESGEECPEKGISKTSDCGVPKENNCSTYDREENISEGHMCELFVYQKMSWAFHTDSGTISQERLNLLDALRLRLKITQDEHKMAMEEAIIP